MNNYTQTFLATKNSMQDNGSVFFNLEKTYNDYKDAVVTYQNRLGEYWTAFINKGKLTDVMVKSANMDVARETQRRFESYL